MNPVSKQHSFVVLAYKESPYLENCIQSLLAQSSVSEIVIATSTPNSYIFDLGLKYSIPVIVNEASYGIADDFSFGIQCAHTELVTLAHQDDFYDAKYSQRILKAYERHPKSLILFSDYGELRQGEVKTSTLNLWIKRIMLGILLIPRLENSIWVRRRILSLGSAISCPAVTYVKAKMPSPLFDGEYKVSLDWNAWERLSRLKGSFVWIPSILMVHRIHEESMTSQQIENNVRSQEDLKILLKFWPGFMARFIHKFYVYSQKSNTL